MASILIVYASGEGQTTRIVERMVELINGAGHEATVVRCRSLPTPPSPEDYDGVLVGSSVHMGNHAAKVDRFVSAHLEGLRRKPTAFFSVSMSAGSPRAEVRAAAQGYVDDFLKETGWKPDAKAIFAGAIRYTHYGPLKRWIMRRTIGEELGQTDLTRDYEYTDWAAVERFVRDFLRRVEATQVATPG